MSSSFLFEIGLEEIPARFVKNSSIQLKNQVKKFFQDNRIEHGEIHAFATPRRLAVLIDQLAESQTDLVEEAKGPAKKIAFDAEGNWSKAAQGFARGQGVAVEDLFFRELKGVEYIYATKEQKGKATKEVLLNLPEVIESLQFPVTMHWGSGTFEYIRPIHWIVALYGEEIVPFTFLDVEAGRVTRGHRFLGSEASIMRADQYEETLREQFVIANLDTRKEMIVEQMKAIESAENWKIPVDEKLLEEVVSLVEYPTAFYGSFDEKYLAVPEEVLITSMKEHQRYFEVTDPNGKLLPYFIAVRNGNAEHLEMVRKGNQKVLTARLEDALFFYEEDQKISIKEAVDKLSNVSFHAKIGSLAEKMAQTAQLADKIAELVGLSETERDDLTRAAQIYKFDLVSNMVGEFPELQGEMGEKYALLQGEKPAVATAIREHYLPASSEGELPQSSVGSVLAAADKLDSIISFFIQDMIPTGSNDPYALRRQMIGVVQMIDTNQWSFSLRNFFLSALEHVYGIKDAPQREKLTQDLLEFTKGRIQQRLQSKQIAHDIQEGILNGSETDVYLLFRKAERLQEAQADESYKTIVEALARVVNISMKAERPFTIDVSLLDSPSEKNLYTQINHLKTIWTSTSVNEKYEALAALEPYITNYFEENMVMVDEQAVRNNRLNMLGTLAEFVLNFADVRKLITK